MASTYKIPSSILIVGSGVFGLSTAWTLTQRADYAETRITVVDDASSSSPSSLSSSTGAEFPPPDAASVDSSRIIRADYADPHYSELATLAQAEWRKQGDNDLGGQGRYFESGLLLAADEPRLCPRPLPSPNSKTTITTTKKKKKKKKKTGMDYVRESWRNVATFAQRAGYAASAIETFESAEALSARVGTAGRPGDWGYLNTLSGWADAGEGMRWQYRRVKATGRVDFVDGRVSELVVDGGRVTGARLAGDDDGDDKGRVLAADLVVVAAGAWTGALVDLRGRCEATGHAVAYVEITPEERDVLARQPVVLNFTSGLFVIPPPAAGTKSARRADEDGPMTLKVARHSFGYLNPVTVRNALPKSPSLPRGPIVASLPMTSRDEHHGRMQRQRRRLPAEADVDLRRAFRHLVPILPGGVAAAADLERRPWAATRLCWYSDTRDGDWLVDYHPGWEGLFVATGDSGHGYKFLPVLGDRVVDCIEGRGGELGAKWRWEKQVVTVDGEEEEEEEDDEMVKADGGCFSGLATEDGSRGGFPGMVLAEELAREVADATVKTG